MKVEGDIYNDTLQLHVIDLILKDVGTAGYTEYDWGTTLAEYFEENEDKWPVMFFSIHSHHTMGVSPSGVDDKHLYDNISNFPFHLSVIVNNKLDFNARIATDMVINTVSVRGMDSNYISKEITDGKIIVEYSLPVSICSTDITEFEEEFNNIKAIKTIKESKAFVNPVYKKFPKQQIIPFDDFKTGIFLNKYTLGTLNHKFVTLNEALTDILTEEDAELYIDAIEKICMDYVDNGKSEDVKVVLSSLIETLENSFSKHPFIHSITYGLDCIHALVDSVQDFEEVDFGKKPLVKDISRMTDQEWKEYILNDK
jgi:hypothetical protein